MPTSRRGRIVGVDAARAVALVGMFATHIFPLREGREPTFTGLVASGRASALFAVLAGVGVALATGGTQRPVGARAHLGAGAALVVRGVLVGAVGLTLVALDAPVAIILACYGVLFVVAAVLLRTPRGVLAAGAVAACVLTPAASQLLRAGLEEGPGDQVGWPALAEPGSALVTLVLTGYYPVLTWTTYLLAGMAVGRLDLHRPQVATGLLTGGVALAVAAHTASSLLLGPGNGVWVLGAEASARRYGTTPTGSWWWLAVDTPHSGSTLDLAATTGSALAVLGAMLLLSRVRARWARPLVLVPAALGSAPLTLYTLHVVALAVYAGSGSDDLVLWLGHVLVAALIGLALRFGGLRGPLESVVAATSRAVRRGVSGITLKPVDSPSPGPPST